MIIDEKIVKLRKERDCLVCRNIIDAGKEISLSVNYEKVTKKISYLYVCLDCLDKLTHNDISIPSINEAYAEYCE